MRKCVYYIGKTPFQYSELVDMFYDSKDKKDAIDFIYSLAEPKQKIIHDKILQVLSEYAPRIKADTKEFGGGELSFEETNALSTLELIDSDYFEKDAAGNSRVKPFREQELRKFIIDSNKDSLGLEESEALADLTIRNNNKISEDAKLLHEWATSGFSGPTEAMTTLKDTSFLDIYDLVYALTDRDSDTNLVSKRNGVLSRHAKGVNLVKNINMKCKLLGIDKDLIGHIDNLIIDANGDLHIINYKIVTTQIHDIKKEKYMYLLALLKLMLANKGFDVEHMTLSIIPIRLEYNEDFTKVTNITPMDKIEYTVRDGKYLFKRYDLAALKLIVADTTMHNISSEKMENANRAMKALWPDRDITTHGIKETAKQWIQSHSRTLIIPENKKEGVYYTIKFSNEDIVEITDPNSNYLENEQIVEEVERRLAEMLIGNLYLGAYAIIKLVLAAYRTGGGLNFIGSELFKRCGRAFDKILAPYIHRLSRKGENVYDWKLIENDTLTNENIIMFQNRITNLIDVITVSPYDLTLTYKFRGGYENILGLYIGDNEAMNRGGVMKGDYGNIEAIRTMFIINEVLSELDGAYTLGKIQVISPENTLHFRLYHFDTIVKEFSKILSVVKQNNSDIVTTNNFTGKKFQDTTESFLQLLDDALKNDNISPSERVDLYDWGIKALEEADSLESKVIALRRLVTAMLNEWGFTGSGAQVESTASNSEKDAVRVQIFKMTSEALLSAEKLLNMIDFNEADMTEMEYKGHKAVDVPSKNAHLVVTLFHRAIDRVSEEATKDAIPVKKYLAEYYEAIGRSDFVNSTWGHQTSLFLNLYEEVNGVRTMRFKNPYTDPTLNSAERKLLKLALFTFAKVRAKMFPTLRFNFNSYTDPELENFVNDAKNSWYLEVPLTKANLASRRATGQATKEWKQRFDNSLLGNFIENFRNRIENINSEAERILRDKDLSNFSITNSFALYESIGPNPNNRERILNEKDPGFFETNVETLLMSFISKQHEVELLLNVLLQSKAILLTLNSIGDIGNPRLKNTIEYITKYLTVNVFNKSIMDEDTKKVIGAIMPARKLATTVYILGNLTAMIRDCTEGVLQNITLSVIHHQTDITKKELAQAYEIVVKNSFTNVRSINLLSALNVKYRISNVDIARIQEVLATGRAGIDNWENWAYATMRRPDFLNRMTLFVALMIHDGVWEAVDIDEDGEITYDPKKDKRFSIYLTGLTEHKDYLKQKGAYYSAILEYNREHPEKAINPKDINTTLLPNPYSNVLIESIKATANSIYGSYDKSTKAMYEHLAIGWALGLFTTWMNGMIGNYFRKPGTYTGLLKEIQSTTMTGELEFIDEYMNILVQKTREDGSVYYINESTGEEYTGQVMPLLKHVPIVGQGIIYSVINLFKKVIPAGLHSGNVIEEIKKEILMNPQEMKNFKKLFSDLFMWFFMFMLYKLVITPEYESYKKERDPKNLVLNTMVDVIYGGTKNSGEGYKGAFNLITAFGEDMNPPSYLVTTKIFNDVLRFSFGDKTFGELLTLNVPVLRNFKNAYNAYAK